MVCGNEGLHISGIENSSVHFKSSIVIQVSSGGGRWGM